MSYTTSPNARTPYHFVLSVTLNGQTVTQTIEVGMACLVRWFIDHAPASCPGPAETGPGAVQQFEHGTMLWISTTRKIVVVRADRTWVTDPDTWQDGMPESDASLTPPAGMFQPVRGFGRLWRDFERANLGWATSPEAPMPVSFQCNFLSEGPDTGFCLVTGPDGLLKLKAREGWELWTGS